MAKLSNRRTFSLQFPTKFLALIRTPTAQVHNFSKRLFRVLHLFFSRYIPLSHRYCRRGRRKSVGQRKRSEIVLGVLVQRSQSIIPSTEPLIFECLYSSNASCHNPSFAYRTHFLLMLLFCFWANSW